MNLAGGVEALWVLSDSLESSRLLRGIVDYCEERLTLTVQSDLSTLARPSYETPSEFRRF
jgi:hypothetical protein